MAGKPCMGNDNVPNDFMLSKAYCEGRALKATGGAYVNPFPVGDAPAHNAFNRGFISYAPGGTNETSVQDCCAVARVVSEVTVPDIIGETPGTANGILLQAGFSPKPINTLLGAIVSQNPVAGATAFTSTKVEYTAS